MRYSIFVGIVSLGVSVVLLAPLSSHGATLKEALEAAYNTNPRLSVEKETLKSTDELRVQALGGFLPTITGSYSIGREKRDFSSGSDSIETADRSRLVVSQPIFNGGATLSSLSESDNKIEAARASMIRIEQGVLLDAVSAYMDVVRDLELLDLNVKNESVLKKHLQVTQERFRLGEVTRTDVAQAQARLAVAQAEKASAEGALAVSRATYKRMIGEVPNTTSLPKISVVIPGSLEEVKALALTNNPALVAANYNAAATDDAIGVIRSSILPEVSLLGEINSEKGTSFSGNSRFTSNEVTLNVSVPLYQGGVAYSRIRQAKHDAKRSRNEKQNTYDAVEEFAIQVWQTYQVTRSRIKSADAAVRAAQVALEGVIQEAQVGSRTTLDVLDAEQELFRSKVDLITAQSEEIVAVYNIKSAIGQLTAQELGLNVELFDPQVHYDDVKYKLIGF